MMPLWPLFFIAGTILEVRGQAGPYYMDQPSACGQHLQLGTAPVYIHGRSRVAPPKPPTSCILFLETDSTDSKYKLEVTIESLSIQDCGIKLEIFDHSEALGQHLRTLACNRKTTETMYSSGRYITLKLSRPTQLYQPGYDFTLQIRAYGNEGVIGGAHWGNKDEIGGTNRGNKDEIGGTNRGNKIGVEVIIPLIIGLLILIIFI